MDRSVNNLDAFMAILTERPLLINGQRRRILYHKCVIAYPVRVERCGAIPRREEQSAASLSEVDTNFWRTRFWASAGVDDCHAVASRRGSTNLMLS